MAQWKREPQEQAGTYRFDGMIYLTATVQLALSQHEIVAVIADAQAFAKRQNGIGYLLVYKEVNGTRQLFFIDQLDDEMKLRHAKEDNYATLLFDFEY